LQESGNEVVAARCCLRSACLSSRDGSSPQV
jgi:hypothetical protein